MKILIVDDEPEVAQRLADGVGATGLGECFAAGGAEHAVEIVNREGGIDVLVTDVFLDGVDGFTLHGTIRPHLPDLCTIFLSKDTLSSGQADRAEGCPVLAKPVDAGALADFIRSYCSSNGADGPVADLLVGTTLGNYRIETLLSSDLDGNFYHAVQTNIERAVELHALDAGRAGDPVEVARFLADARTKANVHHPALLSVFEAGQQGNIYFYTSEPRMGSSLADLAAQGAHLEPRVILQLLHSIAEVMVLLSHEKIAHQPLKAEHVLIDHRLRTRLVNTTVSDPSGVTAMQEMQYLAAVIAPLLTPSDQSQGLQQLLFEMGSESVTLRSWNALLYEVKRCVSGAPSPHSHRLDASGRTAIEAVGAARKRQRTIRRAIITLVILVLLAAGGFWAWTMLKAKPEPVPAVHRNSALETR